GDFVNTSIDWGDRTSSVATVTAGQVLGSHTYNEENDAYPLTAQVVDHFETYRKNLKLAVADAMLTPSTNYQIPSVVLDQPFAGQVASFTDEFTAEAASAFAATIDWGDGGPTSPGSVSGSGGNFTVNGKHTYTRARTTPYPVNVLIQDPSGRQVVATSK